MKCKAVLAALALAASAGALLTPGVSGAASTDVDDVVVSTSGGRMYSTITWDKVVYNGERRDQGEHRITMVKLARNTCAKMSVTWFDGSGPGELGTSFMNQGLGCSSITDPTALYPLTMSRLNEPPAIKAVVCLSTQPSDGSGTVQTNCVTVLPFQDSPTTGI